MTCDMGGKDIIVILRHRLSLNSTYDIGEHISDRDMRHCHMHFLKSVCDIGAPIKGPYI